MVSFLSADLIDWADNYLDDIDRQRSYEALGVSMFNTFKATDGKVSTQVRNLQSMANSATRYSDIELFIKNQMGRDNELAKQWYGLNPSPLDQLRQIGDHTNPNGRDCIVPKEMRSEMATNSVQLRLRLAQGWARAVVGGYMFSKATVDLSLKVRKGQTNESL